MVQVQGRGIKLPLVLHLSLRSESSFQESAPMNSPPTDSLLPSSPLDATHPGDGGALWAQLEPLSRGLHAYAYRMLGGFQDAEDALQEVRLKAWRSIQSGESPEHFRAWVYRIMTNTCLDMIQKRSRRILPQDMSPAVPPGPPLTDPRHDILWLEPYPDAFLPDRSNPEAALERHGRLQLAFIRAIQRLPPRQRAALILHDVLDWRVKEVAEMLETTVPAINSALQRARATLAQTPAREREAGALNAQDFDAQDFQEKEALAATRFVEAWETGNFEQFVSMLADDAIMSMPPWEYWLQGRDAVAAAMQSPGTWDGDVRAGRYRIVPKIMNGQPAGMGYVRNAEGHFVPICLTVLTLNPSGQVSDLTVFVLPQHYTAWGFPPVLGGE